MMGRRLLRLMVGCVFFLGSAPARAQTATPPVRIGDSGWTIGFGAEGRVRFEILDEPGFGLGPRDADGYVLQRYLLVSDVRFRERVHVVTELQSGWSSGRAGGPRPTDVDRLDVHQAFIDVAVASKPTADLTLRVGRQELAFGTGRLISAAEGLNVKRAFDGLRATYRIGALTWNATVLRPVTVAPGIFDDGPSPTQTFWGAGVIAPHPIWRGANISMYYLGLQDTAATSLRGTDRSVRHTIGSRSWRSTDRWDANYEALWQFGTFGQSRISAWAASSDTGLKATSNIRLGVKADIASGDRGRADTLGSFDPLFASAIAYSGSSGLLGPSNLVDVAPGIRVTRGALTVAADTAAYWRTATTDTIYTIFLTSLRHGELGRQCYVGAAPTVSVACRVRPGMTYTVLYSRFVPGAFLDQNPPVRSVNYLATSVTYRF